MFEGSVYAGDTRVLDLQPNEERLVSYAIDLGTEVSVKPGNNTVADHEREGGQGDRHTHTVVREEQVYDVSNRIDDRPHAADRAPEPQGPGVRLHRRATSRRRRRPTCSGSSWPSAAKKDLTLHGHRGAAGRLVGPADEQRRRPDPLLHQPEGSARGAEGQAAGGAEGEGRRGTRPGRTSRRSTRGSRRSRRTRSGCGRTCGRRPRSRPLFQRYLKTLEEQEKEMDDLSAKLKTLHGDEAKAKAAYDDFLANLSAE